VDWFDQYLNALSEERAYTQLPDSNNKLYRPSKQQERLIQDALVFDIQSLCKEEANKIKEENVILSDKKQIFKATNKYVYAVKLTISFQIKNIDNKVISSEIIEYAIVKDDCRGITSCELSKIISSSSEGTILLTAENENNHITLYASLTNSDLYKAKYDIIIKEFGGEREF